MPWINNPDRTWKDRHKNVPKKRRKYVEPVPAVPCDLLGLDGTKVHFFSVKSAKRALAAIIKSLRPKKSPDAPKMYWIEKN